MRGVNSGLISILTIGLLAGAAVGVVAQKTDDPRLNGVYEVTVKLDEFPQLDTDERVEVAWGDLTITNDEGTWSGTWTSTYDSAASDETELTLYELTGAGAYDGLSVLLSPTGSGTDWPRLPMAGAIFPSPLPPR